MSAPKRFYFKTQHKLLGDMYFLNMIKQKHNNLKIMIFNIKVMIMMLIFAVCGFSLYGCPRRLSVEKARDGKNYYSNTNV